MRKVFAAVALAVLAAPLPATASSMEAAAAWCMVMDETGNRRKANNAMRKLHISSSKKTIDLLLNGRAISKSTEYLARQMCPKHFKPKEPLNTDGIEPIADEEA